jgi:hypothetical protein
MTAACIVTANGKRLPITILGRGKTDECLEKFGTNRFPSDVVAMYNESGWMTHDDLIKIINDVIVPYCGGHKCALILDKVPSHNEQLIKETCDNQLITLLYVPAGMTYKRQPLDIGCFGPMKSHGRRRWRIDRINHPTHSPSYGDAVAIMVEAWKMVTPRNIRHAFQRAFDMTEPPTNTRYPAPQLVQPIGHVSLGAYRSDGVESKEEKVEPSVAAVVSSKSKKRPRPPSPYVHPIEDPFEGVIPVSASSSSSSSSTAVRPADDSDHKRSAVQPSTKRAATVSSSAASSSRNPLRRLYHRDNWEE